MLRKNSGDRYGVVAQAFPEATFIARNFLPQGADMFVAEGRLKIKDTERPLRLPFYYFRLVLDRKLELTGD